MGTEQGRDGDHEFDFEFAKLQVPAAPHGALSERERPPWGEGLEIFPVFVSSFLQEGKKKQQNATDPSLMRLPILPGGCQWSCQESVGKDVVCEQVIG